MKVKKVRTNDNPAHLLEKALNQEKVMKYMKALGFEVDDSRAETAPTLQTE